MWFTRRMELGKYTTTSRTLLVIITYVTADVRRNWSARVRPWSPNEKVKERGAPGQTESPKTKTIPNESLLPFILFHTKTVLLTVAVPKYWIGQIQRFLPFNGYPSTNIPSLRSSTAAKYLYCFWHFSTYVLCTLKWYRFKYHLQGNV